MTKAEKARIRTEIQTIRAAVRDLARGAAIDFTTTLSARQIAPNLYGLEDDAGYMKSYKCQSICEGVRVICTQISRVIAVYSTRQA